MLAVTTPPPAIPTRDAYAARPSPRSRAVSVALSLGAAALLIYLLIRMGVLPSLPRPREIATFGFIPPAERAVTPKPKVATSPHPQHSAARAAHVPQPVPKPVTPPPLVTLPPSIIPMTSDQFAASDISKVARRPDSDGATNGNDNAGEGKDSASTYGPGEGPGGQRLYNAEWYREPSQAEMATYLAATSGPGWGEIACKTVDRYHVENCRELGETPGSGLARALRQASWQFLVRPPRIGGKPLVGGWVRIHFDFTEAKR